MEWDRLRKRLEDEQLEPERTGGCKEVDRSGLLCGLHCGGGGGERRRRRMYRNREGGSSRCRRWVGFRRMGSTHIGLIACDPTENDAG